LYSKPEAGGPGEAFAVNAFKRLVDQLDPILHERGRLAIVAELTASSRLTFTQLRDTLEMTDGNLSVHLQKLEEKGYLHIDKQFVGRRPKTSCQLTRAGRQAFRRYLDRLEAIVREGRSQGKAERAR
jgi:DNA-binding transcriptional ArsR family regulator